jgi:hypothetical protein
VCAGCGLAYPVRDDIPVLLLVDEAPQRPQELLVRSCCSTTPCSTMPDGLARADLRLRALAESGARLRREAGERERDPGSQRTGSTLPTQQPRAVVAAGPDSRLLRAVLEPVCPVPFVAWPRLGLPGWVGSLDLVVVLAPEGSDPAVAAATVAEATRRGCQLIVFTPAGILGG